MKENVQDIVCDSMKINTTGSRKTEDNLLQAYQKSVYRDGDMCYNGQGNKCI